jgi:hypothetical protein
MPLSCNDTHSAGTQRFQDAVMRYRLTYHEGMYS